MRINDKKEYMIVLILTIIIVGVVLLMSSRHTELEYQYPEHPAILNNNDFTIKTGNSVLEVGKSTFAEVTALYPRGKTLGMTTIYSPQNSGCLFTFSKKENILIKIHISTSQLSTFRNITINDPFTKVKTAYGKNYARVNKKGDISNFDALYGSDNSIVFQVRNNLVKRIIIQREVN